MLSNPEKLHVVCILVKDYWDIGRIEELKAKIAQIPNFRFFISPQYTQEPRFDIYVVADKPELMMGIIKLHSMMKYIEDISVNDI